MAAAQYNQLTGEIPAELGRLTNLTVLHLSGNQLTGCVPASLQDVANNDFAQLGLPFCPSYDANGNGVIDIGELFSAIDDYFDGRIDISELFTIIDLYFSGATPTATAQPPGAPTGLTATANGPEIENGREFVLGTMQSILLHKEVTVSYSSV